MCKHIISQNSVHNIKIYLFGLVKVYIAYQCIKMICCHLCNFALITPFPTCRERDDLVDHVTSLQAQLQKTRHSEEEAYQQMKKGIELVEQAQLEQTEVCSILYRLCLFFLNSAGA